MCHICKAIPHSLFDLILIIIPWKNGKHIIIPIIELRQQKPKKLLWFIENPIAWNSDKTKVFWFQCMLLPLHSAKCYGRRGRCPALEGTCNQRADFLLEPDEGWKRRFKNVSQIFPQKYPLPGRRELLCSQEDPDIQPKRKFFEVIHSCI